MGDMLQYRIPFRTGEDHKDGAFAGATSQQLPFSELWVGPKDGTSRSSLCPAVGLVRGVAVSVS